VNVVIDTNVLVSGIFFKGLPRKIIRLIIKNELQLTVSEEILGEYWRVCLDLQNQIKDKDNDVIKILTQLSCKAKIIKSIKIGEQLCEDIEDDKFIECALESKIKTIISGDKLLLKIK
jgi:putative PIN family toxin of toxin-antitoxin system